MVKIINFHMAHTSTSKKLQHLLIHICQVGGFLTEVAFGRGEGLFFSFPPLAELSVLLQYPPNHWSTSLTSET